MNGVLNFSVLDGWWYEGYREGAGWALTDKRTYQNQAHQDQLDAATIYQMLEEEIIPLYFSKNSKGYSPEWVGYIKNSFAKIAPIYTTKRMLDDYIERFYSKQAKRAKALKASNYSKAKEIAAWKEKVANVWDSIEIYDPNIDRSRQIVAESGEVNSISVTIDVKDASLVDSFGVELVTIKNVEGVDKLHKTYEFTLVRKEGSKITFEGNFISTAGGAYKFALRFFPKSADLPHRQDFCYVRWF